MSKISWRSDALVFVSLLGLVALTCGLAYAPLGPFNGPVSMLIAAIKAILVGFAFMRLAEELPLIRLAGSAGILMLAIFFVLVFADYLTRAPM